MVQNFIEVSLNLIVVDFSIKLFTFFVVFIPDTLHVKTYDAPDVFRSITWTTDLLFFAAVCQH